MRSDFRPIKKIHNPIVTNYYSLQYYNYCLVPLKIITMKVHEIFFPLHFPPFFILIFFLQYLFNFKFVFINYLSLIIIVLNKHPNIFFVFSLYSVLQAYIFMIP